MNTENLHELINRYENNYALVNDSKNDEKFKWGAVRGFRDVWFSDSASSMTFAQLFDAATKRSSVLINNSMISPTTGIVKMAEQRPKEVERLVREVLFAEYESIADLQNNMDGFLEEIEKIRQDLFPRFYRYKQDRHAASCYLAFYAPEEHFIYRYSEAEEFAKYIEFGKDLGAGVDFKLENYYELAEIVVNALKEHPSLIEKHDALFRDNDHYYYDKSLHLMAFDLMYCCRCYNFYTGLSHAKKKDSIKAYTAQQLHEKEVFQNREPTEIGGINSDADLSKTVKGDYHPHDDIAMLFSKPESIDSVVSALLAVKRATFGKDNVTRFYLDDEPISEKT